MEDDLRFPHVRVPMFLLNIERYPNLTAGMIMTYVAARSFAYVRSKANEKFGKAWPSIPKLAARARQSVASVKRNLKALEHQHLIYRQRRGYMSSMITFIDCPEAFERVLQERGTEAAQAENESHLEEIRKKAWGERAAAAQARRRFTVNRPRLTVNSPAAHCEAAPGHGEPVRTRQEERSSEAHDPLTGAALSQNENTKSENRAASRAEAKEIFALFSQAIRKMPDARSMTDEEWEASRREALRKAALIVEEDRMRRAPR